MAAPPDDVELSLNEVEGLAAKAARGAGLAWGLADDAGRSARWLAAHGADWADSLLALLDAPPGPEGCPLHQGCFLADSAVGPADLPTGAVARPAWLLPPLLAAASRRGLPMTLRLGDIDIAAGADGASAARPWPEIWALAAATCDARIGTASPALAFALLPATGRAALAPAQAARLHAYAARTYVPASAESRARGAGSALPDTD